MFSAEPVCSCALSFVQIARETAGAARIRLSLRPLFSKRVEDMQTSGISRRENADTCWHAVIASEAKQSMHPSRKHGLLRRYRSSQ
jgi:hypothetical protein